MLRRKLDSLRLDDRKAWLVAHFFCGIRTAELLGVAGKGPLALLDHLLDGLADFGASGNNVVRSELVEGTSLLDVAEGSLQILELTVELDSTLLSLRHRLRLERVKRLDLGTHVVSNRLEASEDLLCLGNDVLVLLLACSQSKEAAVRQSGRCSASHLIAVPFLTVSQIHEAEST